VLGDSESGMYVRTAIAAAIEGALVPAADLITPNIWELAFLAGAYVGDVASAVRAARDLCPTALVTSPPSTRGIGALYCDQDESWIVETPLAPAAAKGAGDLFTALFVAHRLGGLAPPAALEAAASATYDVILRTKGEEDLAVIESQDELVHPNTRPKARRLTE
jgi:pyridoxine kinase